MSLNHTVTSICWLRETSIESLHLIADHDKLIWLPSVKLIQLNFAVTLSTALNCGLASLKPTPPAKRKRGLANVVHLHT